MDEVRGRVRAQLRARLLARGAAEFTEQELFDAVETVVRRALAARDTGALLLPEMLGEEEEWRLQSALRFASHRRVLGAAIVFLKRRLLLPIVRWLHEFHLENARRQQRLNEAIFACLEELALENARLRRDLERLAAEGGRPAPSAADRRD